MKENILQPKELLDSNRYEVVRRAKTNNSYSQIYLVKDNRFNGRIHFLKINIPHEEIRNDVSTAVYQGSKDDHIERTKKELKILDDLNHPYIISVNNNFPIKDNYLGVVFEALPSFFVPDQPESYGCFTEFRNGQVFKKFFEQMTEIVDFINQKGYLHRDIKPENILFAIPPIDYYPSTLAFNHIINFAEINNIYQKGEFKLIDFGLTTEKGEKDNRWGSILYQPPEIYRGEQHPNSDLWSLGLTLYEYLDFDIEFHQGLQGYADDWAEIIQNHLLGPKKIGKKKSPEKSLRKKVKEIVGEAANSKSAADDLQSLIQEKISKMIIKHSNFNLKPKLCINSLNYLLRVDPDERSIKAAKIAFDYDQRTFPLLEHNWEHRLYLRDKEYIENLLNPPRAEGEMVEKTKIDEIIESAKNKTLWEKLKFWKK